MRHGEAIAKDMLLNKKKADPNMSGKWVQAHPDQPDREENPYVIRGPKLAGVGLADLCSCQDWVLMKCFDSKVENEDPRP